MALVTAISAVALLTALGSALIIGTIAETATAASFRHAAELFHAAEAVADYAAGELAADPDWASFAEDERMSIFTDGPPSGTRRVGAFTLDLFGATSDANLLASAGADDISDPYRLYAYGSLADLVSGTDAPTIYAVAWVRVVLPDRMDILACAFGPMGGRRLIALSLARTADSEGSDAQTVRISWHEPR